MRSFEELAKYSGIKNLPEGLDQLYSPELHGSDQPLISQALLESISVKYDLDSKDLEPIKTTLALIEGDEELLHLTKFLVQDMCSSRNRCDIDNYNNMNPTCLKENGEVYSLILLLSCIEPSMAMLKERGVPEEHYSGIPDRALASQMKKLKASADVKVADFPWDMNFYTCAIFLFDRFLFIPYRFGDAFNMYRNKSTGQVVALHHKGQLIRRDGQFDGINDVFDEKGRIETTWQENEQSITAYPINPMGFVERSTIELNKDEWAEVLKKDELLLAWHIPSGPGYTPERLKTSMSLALDFYRKYFPEMAIKGFWSESWLYDTRLSLMLKESSNIVQMQRQFYIYPIEESDAMLRYELYGSEKADPTKVELKTSLQKKAADYMASGKRFNTLSMILLSEEVAMIGDNPYITEVDIQHFHQVVDQHI